MPSIDFYPRSPCGERRSPTYHQQYSCIISIHALLAESDQYWATRARAAQLFLSTLSLRRATLPQPPPNSKRLNFYPRSPCGERPRPAPPGRPLLTISIHALLAESDRKEDDTTVWEVVFLSTLSLRRATMAQGVVRPQHRNFYPRSPCGERPDGKLTEYSTTDISIHALLAESDPATR